MKQGAHIGAFLRVGCLLCDVLPDAWASPPIRQAMANASVAVNNIDSNVHNLVPLRLLLPGVTVVSPLASVLSS